MLFEKKHKGVVQEYYDADLVDCLLNAYIETEENAVENTERELLRNPHDDHLRFYLADCYAKLEALNHVKQRLTYIGKTKINIRIKN